MIYSNIFVLYIIIFNFFFPRPWQKLKLVETAGGLLAAYVIAKDQP